MTAGHKFRPVLPCLFAVWFVAGLAALPARADTVIYTFSGTTSFTPQFFPPGPFTFTLTSPSFITADLPNVVPGATLTCSACDFISMLPSHPQSATDSSEVAYDFAGIGTVFFFFAPGSFGAPGTNNTFLLTGLNDGTLTVTVPEPSSLLLLGAGMLGIVVGAVRRTCLRIAATKPLHQQ